MTVDFSHVQVNEAQITNVSMEAELDLQQPAPADESALAMFAATRSERFKTPPEEVLSKWPLLKQPHYVRSTTWNVALSFRHLIEDGMTVRKIAVQGFSMTL